MQDDYSLKPRQALICRAAAVLFLLAALIELGAVMLPIALAGTPAIEWQCSAGGCVMTARPANLLPPAERAEVQSSASASEKFAAYAERTDVRVGLGVLRLLAAVPLVVLMLGVAIAMWRLGARRGQELARAFPWLHRASIAALFAALAPSVANSLGAMLLMPGTPTGPSWYLEVDLRSLLIRLLLAFAAFIVTWALIAGSRARADLAEFI